jgi:hypothetical protein
LQAVEKYRPLADTMTAPSLRVPEALFNRKSTAGSTTGPQGARYQGRPLFVIVAVDRAGAGGHLRSNPLTSFARDLFRKIAGYDIDRSLLAFIVSK